VRGQRHAPAAFYPRERPGTHCTRGWVCPRAGLDRCGKSRTHRDSIPDRPASSQSLYQLSYPAHAITYVYIYIYIYILCIFFCVHPDYGYLINRNIFFILFIVNFYVRSQLSSPISCIRCVGMFACPSSTVEKDSFYLFSLSLQLSAGYGFLESRGFLITHNDAPQSAGRSGRVISSS
jgi:hypothetical protein